MTDERTLTRREVVQRGAALLGAAGVAGSMVESALGTPLAKSPSPVRGGKLRVGVQGGAQQSLHPFRGSGLADGVRTQLVYEPLAARSFTGDQLRLVLAESIEPNRDGSQWTVRLRLATFHDGSRLDADDVVYSFQLISRDPNLGYVVEGFHIAPGGIKAVDRRTVRFTLTEPVADFDERLSLLNGYPPIFRSGDAELDKHSVGTGPFRLQSFRPGVSALLAPNKRYWGPGDLPYLDTLEILAIEAYEARINALRGGLADYILELPYAAAKVNQRSRRMVLHPSDITAGGINFFSINARLKPLDDNRVRLALKLACNRQELIDKVLFGFGVPGNDLLSSPGFADVDPKLKARGYDPARARRLLAQAGATGFKLEITASNLAGTEVPAATLYAEQLRRVGVEASVRVVTPGQLFQDFQDVVTRKQMLAFRGGNGPFIRNASSFMLSNSSLNFWGWLRPEWDRRFQRAQAILDKKRRNAAYQQLQKSFYDEGGVVTWSYSPIVNAASPAVHGVRDRGYGYPFGPNFTAAWMARR